MKFKNKLTVGLIFSILCPSLQPVAAQDFEKSYKTLSAIYQKLEAKIPEGNYLREGLFHFGENYKILDSIEVDAFVESLGRIFNVSSSSGVPLEPEAENREKEHAPSRYTETILNSSESEYLIQLKEACEALQKGGISQRATSPRVSEQLSYRVNPYKMVMGLGVAGCGLVGGVASLLSECEHRDELNIGPAFTNASCFCTTDIQCLNGSNVQMYGAIVQASFSFSTFFYGLSWMYESIEAQSGDSAEGPLINKRNSIQDYGSCPSLLNERMNLNVLIEKVYRQFGVPFLEEIFINLSPTPSRDAPV